MWCSELQSTVGVHARRGVPSKARKEGKRRCAGTLPPVRATRRRCGGPWPSRSSPRSFLPRRWEWCSRSGPDGRRSPRPLPPPPTSGATAARRATRTRRRPGRPLTTRWRCRWRPSRRCSATSTGPRSSTAGRPGASSGRPTSSWSPPRAPTARCTTTRWPTPSASPRCSSTWSRFPGGRLQALSAGWDVQARSAGSTWTRTAPPRPATGFTGRAPARTGTGCAPTATPPTSARATTRTATRTGPPGRRSRSAASRATDRARTTWHGPRQPEGKRRTGRERRPGHPDLAAHRAGAGGLLRRLPRPAGAVHGPGNSRPRAPRPLSPGPALQRASSTPMARSSTRTSSGKRSVRARCTPSASGAATATTCTRGSAAPRGTRSAPAATAPTHTTHPPTTSTRPSGRGSRTRRCSASAVTCPGRTSWWSTSAATTRFAFRVRT